MKTNITFLITALLLLLSSGKAKAQNGIDTSFSFGTGFNNTVYSLAVQPDGKILAGGTFTDYNGQIRNRFARLNGDGTLDTTFYSNQQPGTGFNNYVNTVILQPDGKILAGGNFTSYNAQSYNRIARLNADGSLDTSFTIGTGINSDVYTIALQSDGKILVGGSFSFFDGSVRYRIVRLNADGTLDTSFDIGTGFNGSVRAIAVQPDGKILVGGDFTSYKFLAQNRIARLNTDGSLDPTLNIGTGFNAIISTLVLQPDGKVLVGGKFTQYKGQAQQKIARINTDGTLDNSFTIGTGFEGSEYSNSVNTIALQTDGKILAGGDFELFNGNAVNNFLRLNPNGTYDTTSNIGTGFNLDVYSTVVQPDSKILAGGSFTKYQWQHTMNRISRLHEGNLSVQEADKTDIKIYPNPVKDILYFSKKIHKITVTDFTGKIISTKYNENHTNISGLPSGVYTIVIEHKNGTKQSQKIIKQ